MSEVVGSVDVTSPLLLKSVTAHQGTLRIYNINNVNITTNGVRNALGVATQRRRDPVNANHVRKDE